MQRAERGGVVACTGRPGDVADPPDLVLVPGTLARDEPFLDLGERVGQRRFVEGDHAQRLPGGVDLEDVVLGCNEAVVRSERQPQQGQTIASRPATVPIETTVRRSMISASRATWASIPSRSPRA